MTKQSDYKRYYFHYNEEGLMTVQLSNDPMADCITRTGKLIVEQAKLAQIAQLRILLTYAYQQHEGGGLKKLEQRMETKLNDLLAQVDTEVTTAAYERSNTDTKGSGNAPVDAPKKEGTL